MTDKDTALERLLDVVTGPQHDERARQLALQWPSLAAALGDLVAAYEMPLPRPFRAAANLVREERSMPPVAAVPDRVNNWCYCTKHYRRHLHDGTMPGNPVIDV